MKTLLGSMVLLINESQIMPGYARAKDGHPSTGATALKLDYQISTISIKTMLRVKVVT